MVSAGHDVALAGEAQHGPHIRRLGRVGGRDVGSFARGDGTADAHLASQARPVEDQPGPWVGVQIGGLGTVEIGLEGEAAFVGLLRWLQGKSFRRADLWHARFETVAGLKEGDPVRVSVGRVESARGRTDLELAPD